MTFEIVIMPSCNRLSYSNEQKLIWVKLFKESHFSGKDAKLRFLNHVHYEACLKAGEFHDQFKKKKGYQISPIDTSFLHSYKTRNNPKSGLVL